MQDMPVVSVIKYSIGYAIFLTLWSLAMVVSNTRFNSSYNGILGIAVLFIVYFYLNWSLKALYTEVTLSKPMFIVCGVMIAVLGCSISTTMMWFGNDFFGLMGNKIINSIRAVLVHGVLGLGIATVIAGKIVPSDKL